MNFRLMSVALILVTILGCSTVPQANYSKLGLVQVSGTVTMDGNPFLMPWCGLRMKIRHTLQASPMQLAGIH